MLCLFLLLIFTASKSNVEGVTATSILTQQQWDTLFQVLQICMPCCSLHASDLNYNVLQATIAQQIGPLRAYNEEFEKNLSNRLKEWHSLSEDEQIVGDVLIGMILFRFIILHTK